MHALTDPAVLFFVLGVAAGLLKSNLEVPPQLSRFLSLYLLMALGLKGGFALSRTGLGPEVAAALACALLLSLVVPVLGWLLLRRLLPAFDALAVAATYGSVSAVTFLTSMHMLEQQGLPAGGHMAAAMALMEAPAIVLTDIEGIGDEQAKALLYVGMSRARVALHVLMNERLRSSYDAMLTAGLKAALGRST